MEALERLGEGRPAALVTDLEMPRLDGVALVGVVREDEALKDLPVVMVTTLALEMREAAEVAGVDELLGKTPEDYARLAARVIALLDGAAASEPPSP